MVIKELVIKGFKSFKEKVVVVVDEPVVGIVGPNGCGKSNIVDAIKWVLGEQSAKSLRGGAMGDVIYNGGAAGKGSGCAEVSIKFSTEAGKIPSKYLDYSEIQVTRRLYRNGDSEYLINKTQCRLKDIQDLIMGTGAGPRAYAIVSQGHIDKFTLAKPHERRVFIEEAAGITRYKARKEAAERKIKSTNQNLLRITDIILELTRQNNSLKRQADVARRYKKLKAELRELDLRLTSSEFHEIKDIIGLDEGTFATLEEKIFSLETEINTNEGNLESRRHTVHEEQSFLATLQEKVNEGKTELSNLETEVKINEKEIEEIDARLTANNDRLDKLENRVGDLSSEDEGLGDETSVVGQDIDAEKETLEQMEEQFATKQERHSEISNEKDGLKDKMLGAMHEMSEARNRLVYIDEGITSRKKGIAQKSAEKQEITNKLDAATERKTAIKQRLTEVEAAKEQLEIESEELKEKLEKWKVELSENQSEYDTVRGELTHKNSRLSSLEELRDNFDGCQDGVKSLMLDYEKKEELQGLFGDNISVDSQYEVALESVLGERLQGIIIEDIENGGGAISHLKSTTSGRSSFLPLAMRASSTSMTDGGMRVETLNEPSFHGYLIDKVNIKDKYRSIAKTLLSDVAIVESMDEALRIWNKNQISDRLVTLDGGVITPQGEVSGGSMEAITSGILQKKREIEELNEKIDELEVKNTLISETVARIENQVEEGDERSTNLVSLGHTEDLKILNMEKDISSVDEDMERFTKNENIINFEIDRFESECKELDDERAGVQTVMEEKEELKCGFEETVKNLELEEEGLRDQIEEERDVITDMKVKFFSLKERVDSFRASKARVQRDIESATEDIEEIKDKIYEAETRKKELITLIIDGKASLQSMVRINDAAEDTLRERRDEFQQKNNDIYETEAKLKDLRRDFSNEQGEHNKVQLRLSEKRMKIDNLSREIFEKYGDELEDVAEKLIESDSLFSDDKDRQDCQNEIIEIRGKLERIGEVNIMAIDEYAKTTERLDFLKEQKNDLVRAITSLEKTIEKINITSGERFEAAFTAINDQFQKVFPKLFAGGSASLILDDPSDMLASGVDIIVQPLGKKFVNINLLSGGEKALTAISLLFAIFLINPAPFCVLDEVDAPLDDANIGRFNGIINEMSKNTQFVLITHNKRTMEVANKLYGVTMEDAGYSKLVSVKFVDDE